MNTARLPASASLTVTSSATGSETTIRLRRLCGGIANTDAVRMAMTTSRPPAK